MSKSAVFTIASQNYISYARTLLESVAIQQPECDRFMLLVDELDGSFDLNYENFAVVLAKDIGIEGFYDMAFKYNIMEMNTAVKPFFMSSLLQKGYDKVVYFDPDIMLFDKIKFILDELDRYSMVLTPHITYPIDSADKHMPGEIDYLKTGTYNLGFIAVSNTEEAGRFLAWWSERCKHECYSDMEAGLFVDQKWINLAPGLFDSIKILRHLGCNMAYWNLHERYLKNGMVNGTYPLIFYHFSGIDPDKEEQLSKYQDRYTLTGRSDIKELFTIYRCRLIENGYYKSIKIPYAYDYYKNGEKIGALARRIYDMAPVCNCSPFETGPGSYYDILAKKHLLESNTSSKYTKDNTFSMKNKLDWALLHLLRFLGPKKYDALMKYLRYSSVIRRQAFIFNRPFF
jgi:hypothetical protein